MQEIASPKNGYTVPYLRAVVHHAVVYIRPMQKDLSLDQEDTAVSNIFPLGSVSMIQIQVHVASWNFYPVELSMLHVSVYTKD